MTNDEIKAELRKLCYTWLAICADPYRGDCESSEGLIYTEGEAAGLITAAAALREFMDKL